MRYRSFASLVSLVTWSLFATNISFASSLDLDNLRGGARFSSVDLDAETYDDTVGVGAFVEAPFDQYISFGTAIDYWNTEDRQFEAYYLNDLAISVYGKYNLLPPKEGQITPYGMAGFGLHFLNVKDENGTKNKNTASFDMGLGFEAKITDYIALNAEMKFRNVNKHDYNDYGLGMVAKF